MFSHTSSYSVAAKCVMEAFLWYHLYIIEGCEGWLPSGSSHVVVSYRVLVAQARDLEFNSWLFAFLYIAILPIMFIWTGTDDGQLQLCLMQCCFGLNSVIVRSILSFCTLQRI